MVLVLRNATKINKYEYKTEQGQNPYIGFTSFQHFNGEKLYSDSIVRPENKFTETEPFECYPIPTDVEENGREQGFYPETSVAYFRVLWKDFEPERGVYNYKFIEDIIDGAKAHNQSLVFRLMAHSTRACEDVPNWLKELIPCPERPEGERVKDSPEDPLFVKLFCEAIKKLGEYFDDEPVFDSIDISLPGAWGEGHNLHLYSQELLNEIIDTYLKVFKKTKLITQVSRYELINYANRITPIGWRGDGLGHQKITNEIYPPRIEKVSENWKIAPVSFETYWWLGEWKRQGWNIDEIIEKTLNWHISSLNAKSLPIPFEWKDKIDYWVSKMGYHFKVDYFKYPEIANQSDLLEFEIGIDNCGVAPIYRKLPLKIRLFNKENSYVFDTEADITKWLPGKTHEKFLIKLPDEIESADYDVEMGICSDVCGFLYFCTDAIRNDGFYKLGKISINN